jgi:hypothetical protein
MPRGWQCSAEKPLLCEEKARLLGYNPAADLLLEHERTGQRVWVEFEVSRADPVANHAKFASSRLFCSDLRDDVFVSMVSPHVSRGRRNLASSAIFILRNVGMRAFQTVLFPDHRPEEIKRLNHLSLASLETEGLDVRSECQRALAVVSPAVLFDGHRIHFTSDPFEVMVNLERWNQEMEEDRASRLWGRRRVVYFAHNPVTGRFAPSKFCAFIPVGAHDPELTHRAGPETMTMGLYTRLDESETRFDGNIAWRHLRDRLGFSAKKLAATSRIAGPFNRWLEDRSDAVALDQRGPVILSPPEWFWAKRRAVTPNSPS